MTEGPSFRDLLRAFLKTDLASLPVQVPSGIIPGIPLTCVKGMLKGFKYLERNHLMCDEFYHY